MGHRGYESPSQVVRQGLQPHFHPPPSTSYPSTFHSFTPYFLLLHPPPPTSPSTLHPLSHPSMSLPPHHTQSSWLTERPPSAFPSFFLSPFLHHILPSKVIFQMLNRPVWTVLEILHCLLLRSRQRALAPVVLHLLQLPLDLAWCPPQPIPHHPTNTPASILCNTHCSWGSKHLPVFPETPAPPVFNLL